MKKRCGCYIKWCWDEEDTDYTNLHHINISYTRPAGNPEKLIFFFSFYLILYKDVVIISTKNSRSQCSKI